MTHLLGHLISDATGGRFEPEAEDGKFQYFVSDNLIVGEKKFRLIWLQETNEIYVGVVTPIEGGSNGISIRV